MLPSNATLKSWTRKYGGRKVRSFLPKRWVSHQKNVARETKIMKKLTTFLLLFIVFITFLAVLDIHNKNLQLSSTSIVLVHWFSHPDYVQQAKTKPVGHCDVEKKGTFFGIFGRLGRIETVVLHKYSVNVVHLDTLFSFGEVVLQIAVAGFNEPRFYATFPLQRIWHFPKDSPRS